MVSAGALTLGIFNAWVQFSNNRVKLKIIPEIGYEDEGTTLWITSAFPHLKIMKAVKEKRHRLCVRVINLSNFAVTIHKIGFGKGKLLQDGNVLPVPIVMKRNGCWPLKLESKEAGLLALKTGFNITIDKLDKDCAYVETECGHKASGTSHVFDAYVELLRKQE